MQKNGEMKSYEQMTKKQIITLLKFEEMYVGLSKCNKAQLIDELKAVRPVPLPIYYGMLGIETHIPDIQFKGNVLSIKRDKSMEKPEAGSQKKETKKNINKTNIKKISGNNNIMKYLEKHFGKDFSFIKASEFKKLSNEDRSKGNKIVYQIWKVDGHIWFKTQNWNKGNDSNPKTKPSNIARVCRDRFLKGGLLVKRISQKGQASP